MSLLDTIKDQVAQEHGWKGGFNEMAGQFDCPKWVVDEVARRYATAVAEDALKRAAEGAKTKYVPADEFDEPGDFMVDKQGIISTEINFDL